MNVIEENKGAAPVLKLTPLYHRGKGIADGISLCRLPDFHRGGNVVKITGFRRLFHNTTKLITYYRNNMN